MRLNVLKRGIKCNLHTHARSAKAEAGGGFLHIAKRAVMR